MPHFQNLIESARRSYAPRLVTKRPRGFDFSRYMKAEWICLLLAFANVGFGATGPKPLPEKKPQAELLSLPLSFEANQGQTDRAVKFLSRGDGYALFLTADSAVFKLRSFSENSPPAVMRMKLAGVNSAAKISGAQALPGTVNYFMGNKPDEWTTGVGTFGKVSLQQIYRGIDLVYYGTQRQLEYDFIVAPGADPNQIALEFSGARPSLGADGDLVLTLDGGPLSFRQPVVYQVNEKGDKDVVAASYKLNGDRVQFILGQYDPGRALVIDPVLDYLTYLGGSNTDVIGNTTYGGNTTQGVAVDATGNVYVTGYTQSTDFPVQNAFQPVSTATAGTGYITKLNPAGSQLIYSTYLGGGAFNDDTITKPYAIAVDGSGSAYVTGSTSAPQFPVTAGAYQTYCGTLVNNVTNCPSAQSAFLTKLSPDGTSLAYSTFLGHNTDIAFAVAVDSHGQAYVAGDSGDQCSTGGPNNCFPTTAGAVLPGSAFNTTINPNNFNQGSAFIAVLDAAGAHLLYASLFGGDGSPAGNNHPTFGSGVAVDASGNFYLAGTTQSNQIPVTPGAFQTTFAGNPQAGYGEPSRGFVAKFKPVNAGAALLYATYLGGFDKTAASYQDVVAGIAADAAGNAYLSGNASYDFPATAGANNSTPCPAANSCENRGFLAKLNPAGSALVWATFVGTGTPGPTLSSANTISPPRLDAVGNVYVSGIAGSNIEYPLVNPLQPANNFSGVYVTVYDPTGSTMYFSTVIYDPAANGQIFSGGVDVDSQGNMYVAGYTALPGLPTTSGAFQTALNGTQWDGFIAKISAVPEATGGGSPVISLSASQLQFAYTEGGAAPAPQAITISNSGGGTLTWTATTATPWIALSQTATALTVSVNPAGLPTGANDGTIVITAAGAANSPQSITVTLTVAPNAPPVISKAMQFTPVTPCRVADTRNAAGPFGGPLVAAGTARNFVVPNSACGIPSGAGAYSLNVAVVPKKKLGYVTVWPTGQTQPEVATLTSVDGRIRSNAAIVAAGASGGISVFATDDVDVILDINGYFDVTSTAGASAFYPLTPCRIADTRNATAPLGGPKLSAGSTRSFPIPQSTCQVPAGATAYSLNFAAVPKGPLGYLTAWPTGQPQPAVASLNAVTGTVTANAVIVPSGAAGAVDVYATNDTDLVIDINGYFAAPASGGLSLYAMTPCRVLDSRNPQGAKPLSAATNVNVTASSCGVPAAAQAFVFNASVVPPGPFGYLTLWPAGEPQPLAATLNAVDGAITSNMAIVPTTNGSITAYPSNPTYLILDIFGFFAP